MRDHNRYEDFNVRDDRELIAIFQSIDADPPDRRFAFWHLYGRHRDRLSAYVAAIAKTLNADPNLPPVSEEIIRVEVDAAFERTAQLFRLEEERATLWSAFKSFQGRNARRRLLQEAPKYRTNTTPFRSTEIH